MFNDLTGAGSGSHGTHIHSHCHHCTHYCQACDAAICCLCARQFGGYTWTFTNPYPGGTGVTYTTTVGGTAGSVTDHDHTTFHG